MKLILAALAAGVAVTALLYFPDRDDGSGAILGGLSALVAVPLGLAAAGRYRVLPNRSASYHLRFAAFAFALGIVLGAANLAVNYGMAVIDPVIRDQMVTRWALFDPWSVVVTGPIMEEIAYRLVMLSGLAWIVARFTKDRQTIFYIALGLSSLFFGVAHIAYGGVDSAIYKVGMALKSSGAGLLLGWMFWRGGLPYSILCHCTANGIHLVLMPFLF